MLLLRSSLALALACTPLVQGCGLAAGPGTVSTTPGGSTKTITASIKQAPELVFEDPETKRKLQEGAKLVFEKLEHQFGQVPDKAKLEFEFKFWNGGDKALEILNVKASCGCTTPTLAETIYGPGEEGELEIVWETKGHGGQSKSLDVTWRESADEGKPENPTQKTTVYIRATIIPFIFCTPPRLDFGSLQRGSEGEVFVDIACKDPDFQILSFDTTQVGPMATDLRGEVVEAPSNGKARVRFTYKETIPTFGPRQLFPKLSIRTLGTAPGEDAPKERTHDISGIVVLFDELVTEPAFFAVGKVAPKATFRHEVILKRPSGDPFNVLSTEVENSTMPGVQITAERLPNSTSGDSYKLVLSGDAGSYMGQVRGRVLIHTDVVGDERVALDFMGIVRN